MKYCISLNLKNYDIKTKILIICVRDNNMHVVNIGDNFHKEWSVALCIYSIINSRFYMRC